MAMFSLRRWLKRLSSPRPYTIRHKPSRLPRRLGMDQLEARIVPTTLFWSGAEDSFWSNSNNWDVGFLGSGVHASPATNDDLTFSSAAPQKSTLMDLDSSVGYINSITFDGPGYTGQAFTLGATNTRPSLAIQTFISANFPGNKVAFDIPLDINSNPVVLSITATNLQTDLGFTGSFSGDVNSGLIFPSTNQGIINLGKDSPLFDGSITIGDFNSPNGGGIVQIKSAQGLGTTVGNTTVNEGTELQIIAGVTALDIAEQLYLGGLGSGNAGHGALEVTHSGTGATQPVTWSGNITLQSSTGNKNVRIGADWSTASVFDTLIITGSIDANPGDMNLIKTGFGRLILSAANTYAGTTTVANGILTVRNNQALGTPPVGSPFANGKTIVSYSNTTNGDRGVLELDGANAPGGSLTITDEILEINGLGPQSSATAKPGNGEAALFNLSGNNTWLSSTPDTPTSHGSPLIYFGTVGASNSQVSIGVNGTTTLIIDAVITNNPSTSSEFLKTNEGKLVFLRANSYTATTSVNGGELNIRDSGALSNTSVTVNSGSLELEADARLDSVLGTGLGQGTQANLDAADALNTDLLVSNSISMFSGLGFNSLGSLRNIIGTNRWSGSISVFSSAFGVDPDPDPLNNNVSKSPLAYDNFSRLTTGTISGGSLTKVGKGELVFPVSNTYTGTTTVSAGWLTIRDNQALGGRLTGSVNPFGVTYVGVGDTVQPLTTVMSGAALVLMRTTGGQDLNLARNLVISGLGIAAADVANVTRRPELVRNIGGVFTSQGALVNVSGNNVIGYRVVNAGPTNPDIRTSDIKFNGITGIGVEDQAFFGALGGTAPPSSLTLKTSLGETTSGSGFNKYGPRPLVIMADGYYTGDNSITEGYVELHSDTGLGQSPSGSQSTTSVSAGASLIIAPQIYQYAGGVIAGLQTWSERLVLGGGSNTYYPALTSLTVQTDSTAPNGTDNMWRGPVTLLGDSTITVPLNSRLTIMGAIDDNGSSNGSTPAGMTITGGGKVVLAGTNTYRGVTNINGNSVVTIQSSQALGSAAQGTFVAAGSSLEVQGNLNVSEPLDLQGGGLGSAPANSTSRWFSVGPSPILNGETPGTAGAVSGQITGVAVDPSDSNVIYVTAGTGGIWKTINAGLTWFQLGDVLKSSSGGLLSATGLAGQTLFMGAIAIAPQDPRIIYVGTGDPNNASDSYYGMGLLKSVDSGRTWTLFDGNQTADPITGSTHEFVRGAIGKIIVDTLPQSTATISGINYASGPNVVYLSLTKNASTVTNGVNGTALTGGSGIWKADTSSNNPATTVWSNLFINGKPVITSLSVTTGGSGGGTTTVISGVNFLNANANGYGVKFGNFSVAQNQITINTSGTQMTVVTPAVDATVFGSGVVSVTVTVPGGSTTLSNAFTYVDQGLPSITSATWLDQYFDPNTASAYNRAGLAANEGIAAGGSGTAKYIDLIELQGTGFSNATTLTIGGVSVPFQGGTLPGSGANGPAWYIIDDTHIQLWTPGYFQVDVGGTNKLPILVKATTGLSNKNVTWDYRIGPAKATAIPPPPPPGAQPTSVDKFALDDSSNGKFSATSIISDFVIAPDPDQINRPFNHMVIVAIGDPAGQYSNRVYTSMDDGNTFNVYGMPSTLGSPEFGAPHNGVIKLGISAPQRTNFFSPYYPTSGSFNTLFPIMNGQPDFPDRVDRSASYYVYAMVYYPTNYYLYNSGRQGAYYEMATAQIYWNPPAFPVPPAPPPPHGLYTNNYYTQTTWARSSPIPNSVGSTGPFDSFVAVDPRVAFPQRVITGGLGYPNGSNGIYNGIFISTNALSNNSSTWSLMDTSGVFPNTVGPHGGIHSSTWDSNNNLYVATDGGLWKWNGSTWTDLNAQLATSNLAITQFNDVDVSPNVPLGIVGASQYNGIDVFGNYPVVNSLGTTTGFTTGGTQVVITGSNFYKVSSVTFGGVAAAFVVNSPTQITATAPIHAVGSVHVQVTSAAGTSAGTSLDRFTYYLNGGTPAPTTLSDVPAILTWNQTINSGSPTNSATPPGNTAVVDSGVQVRIDPLNPQNVYALVNGVLYTSTTSGNTWTAPAGGFRTFQSSDGANFSAYIDSFWLDDINPQRILITVRNPYWASGVTRELVYESNDRGVNWSPKAGLPFSSPSNGGTVLITTPTGSAPDLTRSGQSYQGVPSAKVIVGAVYQGTWVADPRTGKGLNTVGDIGANVADTNTIYVLTGDSRVYLTKTKGGVTGSEWTDISSGGSYNLTTLGSVNDLIVDPANRDTAYVVRSVFDSSGRKVFKTTDAGRTWTDITSNLPDLPTWTVTIDPRTNDLYVGTDNGVYKRDQSTGNWTAFGTGMPNVQVRSLVLNTTLNTLTAATYGRGIYQLSLDNFSANAGALRAVSGTTNWTGNITLSGATAVSIGAEGSQVINGSDANIILAGYVGGTLNLDKVGKGTVTLAHDNNNPSAFTPLSGIITVKQGVLVAQTSPNALGVAGPSSYTNVSDGAVLELRTDINDEPLQLHGDGVSINGHSSGSLRFLTGPATVTYSGPITLNPDPTDNYATIGVGTGKKLIISGTIDDAVGTNPAIGFHKELTGTLVLSGDNQYRGTTFIDQGIVVARSNTAFGASSGGVYVRHQTQLQLDGGITVQNEQLTLSGTGFQLQNNGALRNLTGNNTWQGSVLLTELRGFTPTTFPTSMISMGVDNSTDTLTIDGSINEVQTTGYGAAYGNVVYSPPTPLSSFGVTKVGTGKLVFKQGNFYSSTTQVLAGTLSVQANNGLGTGSNNINDVTIVSNGATLEFAGNISLLPEPLFISGTGFANAGVVHNLSGNNTWQGTVVLQGASTIASDPSSSLKILGAISDQSTTAYAITKTGTGTLIFAGDSTYMGQTNITAGTLVARKPLALGAAGGAGTIVSNGATLAFDATQQSGSTDFTISTEDVTIQGQGVNGQGALLNIAGNNTWQRQVTMIGNTYLGSTAGSLTIDGTIIGAAFTVTKVGPGTIVYAGTTDNTYTGLTVVNQGILAFAKNGASAIKGNLTIGLGTNPTPNATVQYQGTAPTGNNQIPDTVAVLVNGDGILDINGHIETLGSLKIVDGYVTPGQNGSLFLAAIGTQPALDMTGGQVDVLSTPNAPGTVTLLGNVTATSSTKGQASIVGNVGTFSLGGVNRTFTVKAGTSGFSHDLEIDSPIVQGGGNPTITKAGTGNLLIGVDSTFLGATLNTAGMLQVDGTIGDVTLNGGNLSGNGTVNNIITAATASLVNPGDNPGVGTLHSAEGYTISFGSSVTYSVLLTSSGGYDKFIADAVSINNATLTAASVFPDNIAPETTFDLITAKSLASGTFAGLPDGATLFLSGQKFVINYINGSATSIDIATIAPTATDTHIVTSSPHNLVVGQPVSITGVTTPAGLNGTQVVASIVSPTEFVVGVVTTGSYTGSGKIEAYDSFVRLTRKQYVVNSMAVTSQASPLAYDQTVHFKAHLTLEAGAVGQAIENTGSVTFYVYADVAHTTLLATSTPRSIDSNYDAFYDWDDPATPPFSAGEVRDRYVAAVFNGTAQFAGPVNSPDFNQKIKDLDQAPSFNGVNVLPGDVAINATNSTIDMNGALTVRLYVRDVDTTLSQLVFTPSVVTATNGVITSANIVKSNSTPTVVDDPSQVDPTYGYIDYVLTPLAGKYGVATISFTVKDTSSPTPLTATTQFTLTVDSPPTINVAATGTPTATSSGDSSVLRNAANASFNFLMTDPDDHSTGAGTNLSITPTVMSVQREAYLLDQSLGLNLPVGGFGTTAGIKFLTGTTPSATYFINSAGSFYVGTSTANGKLIGRFDASYYIDPSRLYNAPFADDSAYSLTVTPSGVVYTDAATPSAATPGKVSGSMQVTGFGNFGGFLVVKLTGDDSRIQTPATRFVLITVKDNLPTVDKVNGTLVPGSVTGSHNTTADPLDISFTNAYDADGDTIQGNVTFDWKTLEQAAYDLQSDLKLKYLATTNYFKSNVNETLNFTGNKGERKLLGSDGNLYWLLQNGALYRWNGKGVNNSGTLPTLQNSTSSTTGNYAVQVAQLDSTYYASNAAKLIKAALVIPATPSYSLDIVAPPGVVYSGNNSPLPITNHGIDGTFTVKLDNPSLVGNVTLQGQLTFSDTFQNTYKYFQIKFTNQASTITGVSATQSDGINYPNPQSIPDGVDAKTQTAVQTPSISHGSAFDVQFTVNDPIDNDAANGSFVIRTIAQAAWDLDKAYDLMVVGTGKYANLAAKKLLGSGLTFWLTNDGYFYQDGSLVPLTRLDTSYITTPTKLTSAYDSVTPANTPRPGPNFVGLTNGVATISSGLGTKLVHLSITDPTFTGALQVEITSNDGIQPTRRILYINIVNNAPTIDFTSGTVGTIVNTSRGNAVTVTFDVGDPDPFDVTSPVALQVAATPAVDTVQAWQMDKDYGFFLSGSYYVNALGQGEKRIRGFNLATTNPTDQRWYALVPTTPTGPVELHYVDTNPTTLKLQVGALITTFERKYFVSPTLLYQAYDLSKAAPPTPYISITVTPNDLGNGSYNITLPATGYSTAYSYYVAITATDSLGNTTKKTLQVYVA